MRAQGLKHLEHVRRRHRGRDHEAAVRQALMRVDLVCRAIRRQEGDNLASATDDERGILEALPVVLHVVAQKEERAVLARAHEGVPAAFRGRTIRLDGVGTPGTHRRASSTTLSTFLFTTSKMRQTYSPMMPSVTRI